MVSLIQHACSKTWSSLYSSLQRSSSTNAESTSLLTMGDCKIVGTGFQAFMTAGHVHVDLQLHDEHATDWTFCQSFVKSRQCPRGFLHHSSWPSKLTIHYTESKIQPTSYQQPPVPNSHPSPWQFLAIIQKELPTVLWTQAHSQLEHGFHALLWCERWLAFLRATGLCIDMLQEVFPHARAHIARVQADHCEALPFQVIGQHCCLCVPQSTLSYLTEPGYAKDMLEVALVGPLTSGAI